MQPRLLAERTGGPNNPFLKRPCPSCEPIHLDFPLLFCVNAITTLATMNTTIIIEGEACQIAVFFVLRVDDCSGAMHGVHEEVAVEALPPLQGEDPARGQGARSGQLCSPPRGPLVPIVHLFCSPHLHLFLVVAFPLSSSSSSDCSFISVNLPPFSFHALPWCAARRRRGRGKRGAGAGDHSPPLGHEQVAVIFKGRRLPRLFFASCSPFFCSCSSSRHALHRPRLLSPGAISSHTLSFLLPSALLGKIEALVSAMERMITEDPNAKALIFSQ